MSAITRASSRTAERLYYVLLTTHRAKTAEANSVRTAFSLFIKISLYLNKVHLIHYLN